MTSPRSRYKRSVLSNTGIADDFNGIGGTGKELRELTTRLKNGARAYGNKIRKKKSKVMVGNIN